MRMSRSGNNRDVPRNVWTHVVSMPRSVGVAVRLRCRRRALAWKWSTWKGPWLKLIGYGTDAHRCVMVNVGRPCQRQATWLEGGTALGLGVVWLRRRRAQEGHRCTTRLRLRSQPRPQRGCWPSWRCWRAWLTSLSCAGVGQAARRRCHRSRGEPRRRRCTGGGGADPTARAGAGEHRRDPSIIDEYMPRGQSMTTSTSRPRRRSSEVFATTAQLSRNFWR